MSGSKILSGKVQVILVCLLVSLLVIMLAGGCGQRQQAGGENARAVPVEVAAAKEDLLVETSEVTGKLEAIAASNVVPGGAGGKVESVAVAVGDHVKKGQTLVVLEHAAQEAALRQAEQGVVQAEAALKLAEIDYQQAKANYERGKMLYEQGAIPLAGPQGFETVYEIPYKKARENFEKVQPARLQSARAALDQARENYNNAFVRAPISGVVTAVNVDPGEMASSASPVPVVSVANTSKVVVKATVSEDLVNRLQVKDRVKVTVAAVSPEPVTGTVTSIAPAADDATKAFPVEVQLDNPEGVFKPGMFATIAFEREHKGIVVPREAVVEASEGSIVWVVEKDKAVRREVKLGPGNDKFVLIKSGLKEGEQVVTAGAATLRDGAAVELEKPGEKPGDNKA